MTPLTRPQKPDGLFGLSRNVLGLGLVSLLTDVSSEMIYPLLPLFLTSVLGAGQTFVGLVEGLAERARPASPSCSPGGLLIGLAGEKGWLSSAIPCPP